MYTQSSDYTPRILQHAAISEREFCGAAWNSARSDTAQKDANNVSVTRWLRLRRGIAISSRLHDSYAAFISFYFIVISSFHELMPSCGVRRPPARPSVCKHFAQIASSTREMAWSRPNLHTMVPRLFCCSTGDVLTTSNFTWYGHLYDFTKSILFVGKWQDCNEICTQRYPRWSASRVCSRSRSKVTWYQHIWNFTKIASSPNGCILTKLSLS